MKLEIRTLPRLEPSAPKPNKTRFLLLKISFSFLLERTNRLSLSSLGTNAITKSPENNPRPPLRARLGRQPVAEAMSIQPNNPSSPPTSNAELIRPAPMPDRLPRKRVARTTVGANTRAIPEPTMNRRIAISGREDEIEVTSTAVEETSIPVVTVRFGPHLAARIPPGICIEPTPR